MEKANTKSENRRVSEHQIISGKQIRVSEYQDVISNEKIRILNDCPMTKIQNHGYCPGEFYESRISDDELLDSSLTIFGARSKNNFLLIC